MLSALVPSKTMNVEHIQLKQDSHHRVMGVRSGALSLREHIETTLENGGRIDLDFSGVEATHSFVDELIGVIVSKRGPAVLSQISFKGCSSTVKGILKFVAADRAKDFLRNAH